MVDRRVIRETYERIAEHFAETRQHPWPEVTAFCADRNGDRALDIGCGNGRHTELLVDCAREVYGVDISPRLLMIARQRLPQTAFVAGDAAALPVRTDVIDLALYVATIHHLQTRAYRRQSLDELARVLTPDGVALVSTWSTAHDRFDASPDAATGFDTDLEWTLPDGEEVPRFYHIYAPAEFEADIRASALQIMEFQVSSGNCYATVTPA